ncbi:MAG: M23 family peptidase, partial [Proteobacteria bacterium]
MRRSLLCLVAALVSTVVSAFDNFDPVPGGIAGVPVGGAPSPAP